MSKNIELKDLEKELKLKAELQEKNRKKAFRKSVETAKKFLETHEPLYLGKLRNSFSIIEKDDMIDLINTCPYSAIIEKGARPHKVSMEGIEMIKQWAMKKLHASEEDANTIAWGTAKKLEEFGQKGNFLVQKSMDFFLKVTVKDLIQSLINTWEKA